MTGKISERLSLLATETNTEPLVGSEPYAAVWLLANAVPKSASMPMTSPVDFISGSAACRYRAVGAAEPVERQHRLLDRDRSVDGRMATVALGGEDATRTQIGDRLTA